MRHKFLDWVSCILIVTTVAACAEQTTSDSVAAASRSLGFLPRLPFESGQTSRIVQGFGGSYDHGKPTRGCGRKALLQYSLDFSRPRGTPVLAVQDGTVTHVHTSCRDDDQRCNHGAGNEVVVDHGNGIYSAYYHLEPGTTVRVGDRVCTGLVVGRVGMTGFTSGPHIHFQFQDVAEDIFDAGCGSNTIPFDEFTESSNLVQGSALTSENALVTTCP